MELVINLSILMSDFNQPNTCIESPSVHISQAGYDGTNSILKMLFTLLWRKLRCLGKRPGSGVVSGLGFHYPSRIQLSYLLKVIEKVRNNAL
jgi:hypothetical protein